MSVSKLSAGISNSRKDKEAHFEESSQMMLAEIEPKVGKVFSDTNLRTERQKACAACGLGTRTLVKPEPEGSFPWYKYEGSSFTTSAGLPSETS
jgi:hypothetical protein